MRRIVVIALSVILALVVAAAPMAVAQGSKQGSDINGTPKVIPPGKQAYALLSGKWWKWAYSVPKDQNPLTDATDPTGEKCAVGQSGGVWFLGSQVGESSNLPPEGFTVDRTCNVPAGKQLFFPIINVECSGVVPGSDPPRQELGCGKTFAENSQIAKDVVSQALEGSELNASVDGVAIENLDPQNTPYHVASGPFTYDLPADSINTFCGADATEQCGPGKGVRAAADGVYLLLAPLPKGQHEILFGGSFFDGGFTMNNKYTINVE